MGRILYVTFIEDARSLFFFLLTVCRTVVPLVCCIISFLRMDGYREVNVSLPYLFPKQI